MLNPFLEPVLLDGVTASSSSPTLTDHPEPPLSAPLTLSFDYTRSVGPTLGKFFTALRDRHDPGGARIGWPRARPAGGIRPGHLRAAERDGAGVGGRYRRVVELASRAAGGPAAGPAVRLGADQARRRRHPADARGGRRQARRDPHRRPGACALGRRAGGRHHRHRLFRARRGGRTRTGTRCERTGSGDHDRHPDLADDSAHRLPRGERLPAGHRARANCWARERARTGRSISRRTVPIRPPASRPPSSSNFPTRAR